MNCKRIPEGIFSDSFSWLLPWCVPMLALGTPAEAGTSENSSVKANRAVLHLDLELQLAGDDHPYGRQTQATPGNAVNIKIFLQNRGPDIGRQTRISLTLPQRLKYVPNSSQIRFLKNDSNVDYPLSDGLIKC